MTVFHNFGVNIPWQTEMTKIIVTSVCKLVGFPGGSDSKESACNAGYLGSIPGFERSPGGGHGNPFQYSGLKNLHGEQSLEGYSPWDRQEPDTTEQLSTYT